MELIEIQTAPEGLPGNDDQAAMASLLVFHLLGLYPGRRFFVLFVIHSDSDEASLAVPSTTQLLVLSPFVPQYTIHNSYMNASTTVTVKNYDVKSVQKTIPVGASAYVKNVIINGKPTASRCHFDFYDTFRLGGEIVIELTAVKALADNCAGSVPESISTGGFSTVR